MISTAEMTAEFLDVAAEIAALQMKTSQYSSDHYVLQKLIPPVVFSLKPDAWWREKVLTSVKVLKEQPEIIFKRQILKILQNLSLFGTTSYAIKHSPDPRLPNGAVLCFNLDGVHVVDRMTKLPVLSCGYNALIDYRYDSGDLVMNTGDLMNKSRLVLHTKEGVQICNTLDSYIEYLVKKRKEAEKKEEKGNQVRPSLKKYSPW